MSVAGTVADPYAAEPRTVGPERATALARTRSGRLRQEGLGEHERNWSIFTHLSPLVLTLLGAWPFNFVVPIVLWLIRRNQSFFNDDHGREVTNFMLSFLLWHLITALTIVGMALWPVLWVVGVVNTIRGAIAAGSGEYFRYPMTIRFLS